MTCEGKERFTTFHLAQRVAKLSARRHEKLKRHAYRCSECGGYHVGSSLGPRLDRKQSFRVLEEDYEYA